MTRDERIGSDSATLNGDGSQYRVDTEEGGTFYAYVKAMRKRKAAFSKAISQPERRSSPRSNPSSSQSSRRRSASTASVSSRNWR